MSYEAMKSQGSYHEATRSKPQPSLDAYQQSSNRLAKAAEWVTEHLPESVGSHHALALSAALRLRDCGRPVTPELVRAQMRLMWPKLEQQVTERGGTFDPDSDS